MSNDIEIIIPQKISKNIKSIKGLSDVMKLQIAQRVSEGIVKIQKTTGHRRRRIPDMNEKCELVIEVLKDRAQFDKHVTVSEVIEILDGKETHVPSFIRKLFKLGKERSLNIKKIRRNGESCYKII